MRSWRSTDNALESIAAAHSDGLLVLDEIGMCDPRIIGETVYMLGNSTGKARANDRGQAGRSVQECRLLILSTGEKTLAQHMAEANKELKAGMEVWMLAVPADASKGLGMFDVLNGFDDAAALSDALKARVAKYYGTPLHHLRARTVYARRKVLMGGGYPSHSGAIHHPKLTRLSQWKSPARCPSLRPRSSGRRIGYRFRRHLLAAQILAISFQEGGMGDALSGLEVLPFGLLHSRLDRADFAAVARNISLEELLAVRTRSSPLWLAVYFSSFSHCRW